MLTRCQQAHAYKLKGFSASTIAVKMGVGKHRVYWLLRKAKKRRHDAQRALEAMHASIPSEQVQVGLKAARYYIDILERLK